MKPLMVVCAALALTGCSNRVARFTVTNPSAYARPDELVVLSRTALSKNGTVGKNFSVVDENSQPVVTQLDDLDQDGQWDEACFLYSFQPNQAVRFSTSNQNTDTAASRAHVRLRKKTGDTAFGPDLPKETMPLHNPPTDFGRQPLPLYLTEGPAWENDKVAFRLYFDTRNGKDIFGKTAPALVMDTVGANLNASYHQLAPWGMDILHAGNSLGAGSLAFTVNGIDSAIRLGGEKVLSETYEKLADGPLRAVFRIVYQFTIKEKPVTITEQISTWGGQYFYQSIVSTAGLPEGVALQTGVANFYENVPAQFIQDSTAAFYSYGRQSENHDNLGMAILVPAATFTAVDSLPKEIVKGKMTYVQKIYDSYIIGQKISDNRPAIYRFCVGWEKSDALFATREGFARYLSREAENFSKPLILTWK
ncbi:DUF4861 domain-containing protein [Flavihumibacter petaseus]|uniref:DUF4861 domain-containing protein n=1 Tax=Flavihumibacter petaseus NBRC 106054 TaxID=1220578 RepID=A0A0E9N609_9BACT|nr:DUF4861 domain-containing protein [Flavihumibacter petaseus]GAO44790.1 hypothetical protein FPE01S_04_00330 [Flavihumibacter petaseus NBRC 106054]